MHRTEPLRNDVAAAELSAAARTCADARLRGVLLALASRYRDLSFSDAAQIWRVDPATLRIALQHFEQAGLDGLSERVALGASPMATRRGRR